MCYLCSMESAVSVLGRQASLLRIEYDAEKEAYLLQSRTMPVQRKVKRGICWFPVRCGQTFYNSLNQLAVEIYRTQDRDVEHSFEYGRPVCFFTQDTIKNESRFMSVTGTVSYVDEDRMVVVLPQGKGAVDIASAQNLGVQLYFDETTYRLMFEALNQVINADKGRTWELREIIHGNQKTSWHNFEPITMPWLNVTQQQAVNRVLAGENPELTVRQKHLRECYVVAEEGADQEQIAQAIRTMPDYFADYDTSVTFITEEEMKRDHSQLPHGGQVIRSGETDGDHRHVMSFSLKLDSNPEFTGSVLLACARAVQRAYERKRYGCLTLFDVPPADLSPLSGEELRAHLL